MDRKQYENGSTVAREKGTVEKVTVDDLQGTMASKFRGSGQTCVSANRIFVHKNVQAVRRGGLVSQRRLKLEKNRVG